MRLSVRVFTKAVLAPAQLVSVQHFSISADISAKGAGVLRGPMGEDFKKQKILIADDLATVRKVLKKLLAEIGFESVLEVSNGEEALQLIQSQSFDLIICDWEMPKLTGIELVTQLRADPSYASLPFILITSHNTKEAVVRAAEAGVSTYISKPFTIDTLREKIKLSLGINPV